MSGDPERIDVEQFPKDIPKMPFGALLTFADAEQQIRWGHDIRAYQQLGRYLIKRNAPIQAADFIAQGLMRHPGDVRLRQFHGLALARSLAMVQRLRTSYYLSTPLKKHPQREKIVRRAVE